MTPNLRHKLRTEINPCRDSVLSPSVKTVNEMVNSPNQDVKLVGNIVRKCDSINDLFNLRHKSKKRKKVRKT